MPPDVPATGPSGPFYKEPAVVIGAIITLFAGVLALLQGDGLADGLQLIEITAILGPVLAGFGIRFKAYSQATVDEIVEAPERKQKQVHSRRRA
jgi:hypothetical protein